MNNHLTTMAKDDSTSSLNSTSTYRPSNLQLLRIALSITVSLLISALIWFSNLQSEGVSVSGSIISVALFSVVVFVFRIIDQSSIVTLSHTTVSVRNGFGILATKAQSIPLEMIHTIDIIEGNADLRGQSGTLHPIKIVLVYKSPARKMLHASVQISVDSIPNSTHLILELARLTKAKIRIPRTNMSITPLNMEELKGMLPSASNDL